MRFLSRILGAIARARKPQEMPAVVTSDDSEFIAEVVRITEVLPHPNADRLDIIHFERKSGPTAYTVVDRKGRSVGDLVGYVGVDSLLPTKHPEFSFLKERPDGQGKAIYRLRAARLRKVYSEGLVFDLAEDTVWNLGDDVSRFYGVGYHNPSPPEVQGPTPPAKRRRDWRNFIPQYSVTSLRKAPKLFEPGEEVWVTEKVHGTNVRFGRVKGQFLVGSHRTWKTDNRRWWQKLLGFRKPGPGWYGEDIWVEAARQWNLDVETESFPGIVFYGELYGFTPGGKPIQDLTYGLAPGSRIGLRLFDAWDAKKQEYLPRQEVVLMAAEMGVDMVPVLHHGPANLLDAQLLAEGRSTLDKDTVREGVVITSASGDRRGKWVGETYRTCKEPE